MLIEILLCTCHFLLHRGLLCLKEFFLHTFSRWRILQWWILLPAISINFRVLLFISHSRIEELIITPVTGFMIVRSLHWQVEILHLTDWPVACVVLQVWLLLVLVVVLSLLLSLHLSLHLFLLLYLLLLCRWPLSVICFIDLLLLVIVW